MDSYPAGQPQEDTAVNLPVTSQQEEKPTLTPTPVLECVYLNGPDNDPVCFVDPTLTPNRYPKIHGNANRAVHEAEEAMESGGSSEVINKKLGVGIIPDQSVENAYETIANWLDEREIDYYSTGPTFSIFIPAIQLAELAKLEAVGGVRTPTEPTPTDVPQSY